MELISVKKGETIAKRGDNVKEWYLVQKGSVVQKYDFVEITLKQNAIIGILEQNYFLCDYVAAQDTQLAAFRCQNQQDLTSILSQGAQLRRIFLRSAISQRHQVLGAYARYQKKCKDLRVFAESIYNEYKQLCNENRLEEINFPRMENFLPIEMKHKAEAWEINSSNHLVKTYLESYLQLMEQDDSLSIGVIMEVSAQMRRVALGLGEMVNYLNTYKDLLLSESKNDFLHLFYELEKNAKDYKRDTTSIEEVVESIVDFIYDLVIFDENYVDRRLTEYQAMRSCETEANDLSGEKGSNDGIFDIRKENCLRIILDYAEYAPKDQKEIETIFEQYKNLPDKFSRNEDAYKLRKQLTKIFYDIYTKVFFHTLRDAGRPTPVITMFLNFGFMDVDLVGEENALALYELSNHLQVCRSKNVYTIYDWLFSIYRGENVPSKNEFDLDYPSYLNNEYRGGQITSDEMKQKLDDAKEKLIYELSNMFPCVNKITYGKVTTFCPVLNAEDLGNSLDRMLVTVQKLEDEMNNVRKADFSIFYRDGIISDPLDILTHETIKKEVLPNIILMPNAGSRAMMWQETEGPRRDTKARFMFPIFATTDLSDMMLETMAQFRWEMCRKEQGVHWNDIMDKSLTAEYCDYLQFYRKNNDLSKDGKEKVKNALKRAKNSYKEVFVRDYVNWVKFESKGGCRLNKIAQDILGRYCPFSSSIREDLKNNPMYQAAINKYEIQNARALKRLNGLYTKYKNSGGEITPELKANMHYYEM